MALTFEDHELDYGDVLRFRVDDDENIVDFRVGRFLSIPETGKASMLYQVGKAVSRWLGKPVVVLSQKGKRSA